MEKYELYVKTIDHSPQKKPTTIERIGYVETQRIPLQGEEISIPNDNGTSYVCKVESVKKCRHELVREEKGLKTKIVSAEVIALFG